MTSKKLCHFSDDKWNHKAIRQIKEVACRLLLKKKSNLYRVLLVSLPPASHAGLKDRLKLIFVMV